MTYHQRCPICFKGIGEKTRRRTLQRLLSLFCIYPIAAPPVGGDFGPLLVVVPLGKRPGRVFRNSCL